MEITTRHFTEEQMIFFIKDMLCLNKRLYKSITKHSVLLIETSGDYNHHSVQKAIYAWLSIPERKYNFDLLSDVKPGDN